MISPMVEEQKTLLNKMEKEFNLSFVDYIQIIFIALSGAFALFIVFFTGIN